MESSRKSQKNRLGSFFLELVEFILRPFVFLYRVPKGTGRKMPLSNCSECPRKYYKK